MSDHILFFSLDLVNEIFTLLYFYCVNVINKMEQDKMKNDTDNIPASEIKRIKEAIERSDTEKFLLFTRLMRIHFMLKNAVITKK